MLTKLPTLLFLCFWHVSGIGQTNASIDAKIVAMLAMEGNPIGTQKFVVPKSGEQVKN